MKKLGLIIGIGLIILTGCVQPQYNPNNKVIVMMSGESFRIPRNTIYNPKRYDSTPHSLNALKQNIKLGLNCKIGDLGWLETSTRDKFMDASKDLRKNSLDGLQRVETLKIEAIRMGKMGCAHPLTDREYNHYRGKEMEDREDDIRARTALGNAFTNAGNNFKTNNYNVNVSGTVNHNVNVTSNPYYRY